MWHKEDLKVGELSRKRILALLWRSMIWGKPMNLHFTCWVNLPEGAYLANPKVEVKDD